MNHYLALNKSLSQDTIKQRKFEVDVVDVSHLLFDLFAQFRTRLELVVVALQPEAALGKEVPRRSSDALAVEAPHPALAGEDEYAHGITSAEIPAAYLLAGHLDDVEAHEYFAHVRPVVLVVRLDDLQRAFEVVVGGHEHERR